MKRFLVFALPILGTFLVLGLGVFLVRTQPEAIRTRFGALRETATSVAEEVAHEVKEVLE
jgi:hypothetical protein